MNKESACNVGDTGDAGLIPESERYTGGGHGNPLQYTCLETSMDRGAWQATVHGIAESDMTEKIVLTDKFTAKFPVACTY